ncbi:hypothetical protein DVH05_019644 [Phytophthora capsici]|nr:hypothetical protein DVH05_015307 [Phytophthora capsici]KAG1684452.1 hypothetical protein DVH05_011125 [Phytophthora capsici]KAG1695487.1 hypothetical protein DVH05_019644 [Phytophthora capsici]
MSAGVAFQMAAPSRDDVVEWITAALSELSADTIAHGFNGVLRETTDDEAPRTKINSVVERLEQLKVLDGRIGEVDRDFIDSVVDNILYAEV